MRYGYDIGYGHHGDGPHHYPWFRRPQRFLTQQEQVSMLEDYRKELEQELKDVEQEIRELRGKDESAGARGRVGGRG